VLHAQGQGDPNHPLAADQADFERLAAVDHYQHGHVGVAREVDVAHALAGLIEHLAVRQRHRF
jgi:hypothetical protein